MSTGKPQFHEDYANDQAVDGYGVVDFPYNAIDGLEPNENPHEIVAEALVRLMIYLVEGDLTSQALRDRLVSRYGFLCLKAGLVDSAPDRKWALNMVDTPEQAKMLVEALRIILPALHARRKGRPFVGNVEALQPPQRGVIVNGVVSFAWLLSPAILEGKSLKLIASELGIHENTLSIYAANLSRVFNYRNHAQSKGWNWQPRGEKTA